MFDPQRLIPAWAGKTQSRNAWSLGITAHPRVGGENAAVRDELVTVAWLIPAWAGKTGGDGVVRLPIWAHPRVGGENAVAPPTRAGPPGSSPRGRGKPHHDFALGAGWRLIPAWAGKTIGLSRTSS